MLCRDRRWTWVTSGGANLGFLSRTFFLFANMLGSVPLRAGPQCEGVPADTSRQDLSSAPLFPSSRPQCSRRAHFEPILGHTPWPYALAIRLGHTPWPYALAVRLGRTPWPCALAVRLRHMPWPYALAISLRLGRTPRPYASAVHLGRTPRPYASAVRLGRTPRPYALAVRLGRTPWP